MSLQDSADRLRAIAAELEATPTDEVLRLELALRRADYRFFMAYGRQRYIFRPGPTDDTVELVKVVSSGAEPFDPPYIIDV